MVNMTNPFIKLNKTDRFRNSVLLLAKANKRMSPNFWGHPFMKNAYGWIVKWGGKYWHEVFRMWARNCGSFEIL